MDVTDQRAGGAEPRLGALRRRQARRPRGHRPPVAAASLEARVAAAIEATARSVADARWREWAARWVSGADRSEAAAHLAFAIADAAVDSDGVPPPRRAHPAAAARTAAQLAIGLARVEALRGLGEDSIASALAHVTAAMAERLSVRAALAD